jgi:hypothetical protein
MEPLLLGLAAPSIASTAGAIGRVVAPVAKLITAPFASVLQQESQPPAASSSQAAETQAIELKDLHAHSEALQTDLESRIQRAIKDSGVQLNFPIRLRLSEFDGRLEADAVASPQREILEASLASDPSLADDFRQLAAVQKLLSAAEDHGGFSEAYARDPHQAIINYAASLDDRFEAQLQLSETDNQLQLVFE